MKRLEVWVLVVLCVIPLRASAQALPESSIKAQAVQLPGAVAPYVLFQVIDAADGSPVAGAQVFFAASAVGTLTDSRGFAVLPAPSVGSWSVGTRLVGYLDSHIAVDADSGSVIQVLAALRRDPAFPDSIFLAPPMPAEPAMPDTTSQGR